MPCFRVVLEVMETHEREIEALDEDRAEDLMRAEISLHGLGNRKVYFCHAWPVEDSVKESRAEDRVVAVGD